MRRTLIFAAALCALAGCASGPASSVSTGSWAFTYDTASGAARATQSDQSAWVTCQAPTGDMMLVDTTLGGRGVNQAQLRIGQRTITVPAQSDGRNLNVRLPRRPPNLSSGAYNSTDAVTLSAGGRTHTFAPDAVQKLAQVANACWPSGS